MMGYLYHATVKRSLLPAALIVIAVTLPAFGQFSIDPFGSSSNTNKSDSQGFLWDISQYGNIGNGTNNCFSGAAALRVNNSSFSSPTSRTMSGDELILSRSMSGLEVTRRIKVDVKNAYVRYVEMFRNPGTTVVSASIRLQTQMGRGPGQALITDTGMPAQARLGDKDSGLILVAQQSSQTTSVLFYLAGAKSAVKPAIRNQSNYEFYFTYQLNVDPGKTVSIVHGMAQRRLAAIPHGKAAAKLFDPFLDRSFTRDLPRDVRRSIANLGRPTLGGWDDEDPLFSLDSLGIERQTADVLAIGEITRLQGAAAFKSLTVDTAYGTLDVALDQVAAIAGPRFSGQEPRIYLTDGQIFSGPLTADGLSFTLNSGQRLDLEIESLDRLVMRTRATDGQPSTDVVAMLETSDGDCLALLQTEDQHLAAATPWGDRKISLEDIERLVVSEDRVGHRVALRDGNRLFAFLDSDAVSLTTLHFGPQPFAPVKIRRMIAAHLQNSKEYAEGDLVVAHMLLVGENVLVGQIDLPAIHFIASGQKIPMPPNQIRRMTNVTGQADESAAEGPAFEAELWDGGAVSGELMELVLPVQSGDCRARVPANDIVEVIVPSPSVPDTVRNRIAQLIRDLGHPEYAERKAARETLAELGHLPKMQLEETLNATTDPEIRRSVESLMQEIDK